MFGQTPHFMKVSPEETGANKQILVDLSLTETAGSDQSVLRNEESERV